MYLFGSGRRYVNVYAFELDKEEAKKFKINEMKRLSEDTRVYSVEEKVPKGKIPVFTQDLHTNLQGYYTKEDIKGMTFTPYEKTTSNYVLRNFYNGIYTNTLYPNNLVKIRERENSDSHAKYYLVGYSSTQTKPMEAYTVTTAYQVIRIPKSLYLLQALEQGSFHLVNGYPLDRQLSLFQAYHVDDISIESIKDSDRYGITTDAQKNLERKILNDEPLIRILKQKGEI